MNLKKIIDSANSSYNYDFAFQQTDNDAEQAKKLIDYWDGINATTAKEKVNDMIAYTKNLQLSREVYDYIDTYFHDSLELNILLALNDCYGKSIKEQAIYFFKEYYMFKTPILDAIYDKFIKISKKIKDSRRKKSFDTGFLNYEITRNDIDGAENLTDEEMQEIANKVGEEMEDIYGSAYPDVDSQRMADEIEEDFWKAVDHALYA